MTEYQIITKLHTVYKELSNTFNFKYDGTFTISISNRLRSMNGYCELTQNRRAKTILSCKIVMSKGLLDDFGWDRFEKTFRHEVAHLVNSLNGGRGHGESFKRLCRDFGGSMNTRMAGKKYAECATADFVEVIAKWIYTCPCGYQRKMTRRMTAKKRNNPRYMCGSCRIHKLDTWKEEKVG